MSDKTPYETFAERMFQPDSKYIPEILKYIINDDQAKILVTLPGSAEELSEKLGRSVEDINADLKDMFYKGLAFKKVKNDVTLWRPPMHIAQFHDATILWPEATVEFLDIWQKYMDEEWPLAAPAFTKLLPRPFTRVVPIEKSVDTGKTKILTPDNLKEIIDNSSTLAVANCTCRLSMRNCDSPNEVCLQINRGAEYTIERGTGREVTKEEAHTLMKQAEDAGLVHVALNKADAGHFICNCCGCCCQTFTMLISDDLNLCDPSRYRASIDADKCTACGECVDRCWFNALELKDDTLAITEAKCLGCGQCSIVCPEEAILLEEIREIEFIPQ